MSGIAKSRLKRPLHPMPSFVEDALNKCRLMEAYRSRPPYQQNDYIGWIVRARREATRLRRLDQMLEELEGGALYMKMAYKPRKKIAQGKG